MRDDVGIGVRVLGILKATERGLQVVDAVLRGASPGLQPENLVGGFVLRWFCRIAARPAAHTGSQLDRTATRCITEDLPSETAGPTRLSQ